MFLSSITKKYILSFVFSLLIAVFTAHYSKTFIDGDITKYKKVYEYSSYEPDEKRFKVSADPTIDIWGNKDRTKRDYYSKNLTSREITHFFLISFFSKFISYEKFLGFLNFCLVFLIFILFLKKNTNYLIILSFIFTNYYMLIIYFSAERLKVGIIFGLISLILMQYKKISYLNILISVLSHFQLMILYSAIFMNYAVKSIVKVFSQKIISIYFLILTIFSLLIILFAREHIIYKLNQLSLTNNEIIIGWLKITIFLILTYINFRKFTFLCILFLPIYLATLVVGPNRLIILVFAIFVYFSIQKNRGVNIPLIIVFVYFFAKSISLIHPLVNCNTVNMDSDECKIFLYNTEVTKKINANYYLTIEKYK